MIGTQDIILFLIYGCFSILKQNYVTYLREHSAISNTQILRTSGIMNFEAMKSCLSRYKMNIKQIGWYKFELDFSILTGTLIPVSHFNSIAIMSLLFIFSGWDINLLRYLNALYM